MHSVICCVAQPCEAPARKGHISSDATLDNARATHAGLRIQFRTCTGHSQTKASEDARIVMFMLRVRAFARQKLGTVAAVRLQQKPVNARQDQLRWVLRFLHSTVKRTLGVTRGARRVDAFQTSTHF